MPQEEEQINQDLAEQEKLIQEVTKQPAGGASLPGARLEARPKNRREWLHWASVNSVILTAAACAVRKAMRGDPGHCRRRCALRRD